MSRRRRRRHAGWNPWVAVLVLAAALAAPTVGCKSSGSDDRRGDEYVPPEPDRQQHDAPPRRPHY
jgi:hypothetical protein